VQIVFCSSSWLLSLPASVSKSRSSAPGKIAQISTAGMAWGDLRFSWPSFSSSRRLSSSSSPSCNVAQRRSVPELYEGIAKFYDNSSGVWEDMWGEHMHHGYYDNEGSSSQNDHLLAQIAMIENSLAFAQVPDSKEERPAHVVDVGCGIGGSARYLARKYEAKVSAITLSPVQAARGNVITASQGLSNLVTLQVANALKQPFEDGTFDLVWSMESGEHMPDKQQFVGELARVAAPGGRIIIVTWCHRNLELGETCLKPKEQELLDKICDAYYLPAWCSPLDYVELLKTLKLEDIKYADWSKNVTPFWPAVMASALSFRGLIKLATSGWTTIRGALAMALMVQGYQMGLIKFAIITAHKPL
jgi:tocopherol O-methyltransferase